jgi:Ca2+-binding RTX toxin-like protein
MFDAVRADGDKKSDMDYYGTEGDDTLDQRTLNGASPIYGLGGNDTILSVDGHMIGGPGNDTLIALGPFATATYWNSPKGVVVDLQFGTAQDGFGTTDILQNIRVVHGSGFADQLFGSAANEVFHGHGGNDLIDGRGGIDTVQFIFTTPEGHAFQWDAAAGGRG